MKHDFNGVSFIGVRTMARKLDVPVSWLYAQTRVGLIPHYRIGKYIKFSEAEVMEWIQRKTKARERSHDV